MPLPGLGPEPQNVGGDIAKSPCSDDLVLGTEIGAPEDLGIGIVDLCKSLFAVEELFPGTAPLPIQSNKNEQLVQSVTTTRPTNINVVPIDYAFLPRLRGRLTLLRLTLSRNPWSFGERVSHPLYRYSCQHSHFRYLQEPSRVSLHQLTERSATTCITANPQLRCMASAPLHFRRKDPYLDQ